MANITIKQAIKMAAAAAKAYTDQVASTKVNIVSGKGLSTNDLTNDMVANYGAAYQHSLQAHAPSNAQKNSDITKAEIEAKLTGNIDTHTHSYLPLAGGTLTGSLTIGGVLSDSRITTGNKQLINTNGTVIYVGNPATGLNLESKTNPSVNVGGTIYTLYHTGNKPTYSDVGIEQISDSEMMTLINEVFDD